MIKNIFCVFIVVFAFIFPSNVSASEGYLITNFNSEITVRQNTSLEVVEKIDVLFEESRHGIYRIIPKIYTSKGKTINSRLKVESVTDSNGSKHIFEKESFGQSIRLKIGDPEREVQGLQTYIIKYTVSGIIQKYDDVSELYWNVTGSEWDTQIQNANAVVNSPFANIDKTQCYSGIVGSGSPNCRIEKSEKGYIFLSDSAISPGQDFTVAILFSQENNFIELSVYEKVSNFLLDNWGYFFSFIPFFTMFYFWFSRGRDLQFGGDNIYYEKEDSQIENTSIIPRKHIPLVYSPIKNLSPSQLGTIRDEKVDIQDLVGELTELARMGFIKIERVHKKKILKDEIDYVFYKFSKDSSKLRDYQKYLLDSLFTEINSSSTISKLEKLFGKNNKKTHDLIKIASENNLVLLSVLKNVFYEKLQGFKDKLYKDVDENGYFAGDPEKIRGKWIGLIIIIFTASMFLILKFGDSSANYLPLIFVVPSGIMGFILALKMPRRTAKGYSLLRQIEGLIYYTKKGKWRYEIHEKNLFFEEMFPLAVSLGIVNKLTKDMEEMGVKPPSYFSGFAAGSFSSDLSNFSSASSNTFVSAPGGRWSGSSSWSGGSGFSGGSSGGGFGGGGGGSW